MKKILLSLASVALMMSACTQDVAEQESNSIVNFDGNVTVTATMTADTRTAMSENAAGGLDITWVEGDAIGLSGEDELTWLGANVKYTATQSAATTGFVCADPENSIKWGEGTHNFYAYYPYTEGADDFAAVPATIPAVQKQSAAGNLDHLQPYSFLYAACEASKTANGGTIELQFNNAFSVLELDVCAEAGSVNCEGLIFRADDENEIVSAENILVELEYGDLDYSEATNTSNEIRIDLGEGVTLDASTPQKFYMLITPGHANKRFSFYAVVNGKEVLLGNKGIPAAGLPAGRKAVLSLNVPVVDLSADGTANCYIVNKPNTTYKFKATVMGNGATTTGITPKVIAPTKARLARTIVASQGYKGGTTYGSDGTMSKLILRNSVELKDGYIYFTTPATLCPGNAIIYATDNDDKVLWSWHMWVAPDYDAFASAIPTYTGTTIMDRNLGAYSNGGNEIADVYASLGLAYQFGRKDPFLITNIGGYTYGNYQTANGTIDETRYVSGYRVDGQWLDGSKRAADDAAFADFTSWQDYVDYSIANPYCFIKGSSGNHYTWLSKTRTTAADGWGALWGNGDCNQAKGSGVKTIYDPCPVGWKTPAPEDFKFFGTIDGPMSPYYHYDALWRYNWDQTKTPTTSPEAHVVTVDATAAHGYWFYGSKIDSENEVRKDTRTTFFPASSEINYMILYGGSGWHDGTAGMLQVHSNCPKATDKDEIHRPNVKPDGNIWFTGDLGYEQQACALAVRCVREANTYSPAEKEDILNSAVDLSKNGTANTYVVSDANTTYKFKATIKGNGIDPIGSAKATIKPTKARILWAQQRIRFYNDNAGVWPSNNGDDNTLDKTILKSSVTLLDGYIVFKTNAAMEDANVIIAALDDQDNILWSWQMWCCNGYNPAETDYYVTTKNINTYMMDRDLGAFSNPGAVENPSNDDYVGARGMLYQWGRKDPFPACRTYNGYNPYVAWLNNDGTISTSIVLYGESLWNTTFKVGHSGEKNLAKNIETVVANPQNFYTVSNWANGESGNVACNGTTEDWGKLWGNQANAAKGIKTMYDPCPVGYTVPTTSQFNFVTSHNDDISEGWAKPAPWKLNCKEDIFDNNGVNVGRYNAEGNPFTNSPFGLNFYVKGAKTAVDSTDPNYNENYIIGNAPSDATTAYFPNVCWITWGGSYYGYGGSSEARIVRYTNAPSSETAWCGQPLRMHADSKGNFYYRGKGTNNLSEVSTAVPIRCVRE